MDSGSLFPRTGLLNDFRVRFAGSFRTVRIKSPERDEFFPYTPESYFDCLAPAAVLRLTMGTSSDWPNISL